MKQKMFPSLKLLKANRLHQYLEPKSDFLCSSDQDFGVQEKPS